MFYEKRMTLRKIGSKIYGKVSKVFLEFKSDEDVSINNYNNDGAKC